MYNLEGGFTSWEDFELYREDGSAIAGMAMTKPYMAIEKAKNECMQDVTIDNDMSLGDCLVLT